MLCRFVIPRSLKEGMVILDSRPVSGNECSVASGTDTSSLYLSKISLTGTDVVPQWGETENASKNIAVQPRAYLQSHMLMLGHRTQAAWVRAQSINH